MGLLLVSDATPIWCNVEVPGFLTSAPSKLSSFLASVSIQAHSSGCCQVVPSVIIRERNSPEGYASIQSQRLR